MHALKRFEKFQRKVSKNFTKEAFCLKADIKHYFREVNHSILINLIEKKIKDEKAIGLILKILKNSVSRERERDASNFFKKQRDASGQFDQPIFCECLSR